MSSQNHHQYIYWHDDESSTDQYDELDKHKYCHEYYQSHNKDCHSSDQHHNNDKKHKSNHKLNYDHQWRDKDCHSSDQQKHGKKHKSNHKKQHVHQGETSLNSETSNSVPGCLCAQCREKRRKKYSKKNSCK